MNDDERKKLEAVRATLDNVREDLRAYRATLAEKRLTVFGLFKHPDRSHCRVAKYSAKPPINEVYTVWNGPGRRVRIHLTEYPAP